ncbi:MAG: hypothetical protein UZ17_ACD001002908 [Acidobacteria bacterium OLB17]|nr:MAG: hypothetical protein UZ17_ACD001002908 [Acidobacteria bacterium OLB17]
MEIDHSSANLPHILFHLGLLFLLVIILLGPVLIMVKIGSRRIKSKENRPKKAEVISPWGRRKKRRKGGRKKIRRSV